MIMMMMIVIPPWSFCPPAPQWRPNLHCWPGTEHIFQIYILHIEHVMNMKEWWGVYFHTNETYFCPWCAPCCYLGIFASQLDVPSIFYLNIVCVICCLVQGAPLYSVPWPAKMSSSAVQWSHPIIILKVTRCQSCRHHRCIKKTRLSKTSVNDLDLPKIRFLAQWLPSTGKV